MASWWKSRKPQLLENAKSHIIDDLTILQTELGIGSYGTTYAAVYDGKPCAVKEVHPYLIKNHPVSFNYELYNSREINTLSCLRHPNIVQFLGVYFKSNSDIPMLVMERMWKNLFQLLEERPSQLSLLIKTHILYDVTCGLQYLHGKKKPVVHRCLGANNIMLTKNLEAKIVDFGQAKYLENLLLQKLSTCPGNHVLMPPEALEHNPTYDTKLDIFSFGCTVLHVVTEKFPMPTDQFVESATDQNSFLRVSEIDRRKTYIDLLPSNNSLFRLITWECLQDTPTSRPTASNIRTYLEKHLQQFEIDSPELAKQFKQDKLLLILSIQMLENELESVKKVSKECSEEKQSLKYENEFLQMELLKQNKLNEELITAHSSHINKLADDLKEKQEEVTSDNQKYSELLNEVNELQTESKDCREIFREVKDELQNTTDSHKQEIAFLVKEREDYRAQLIILRNQLEFQCDSVVKIITQKCAENEKLIDDLSNTFEQYQMTKPDGNLWHFHRLVKENEVLRQTIIRSCNLTDDKISDISLNTTDDGTVSDSVVSNLSEMSKHLRSQRDQLQQELNETKKYAEFLKKSIDMEEERRAKINDELQQVKATSTTVEENIKQLLTTWDDVKIKIEKFLQVVEGKERTINLPVQLQKSSDESAENKSIICKIILDLQEWSLVIQQVQLEWINPLESQLIEKSENMISLDKELQEEKGKKLSNQIKVNQLEEDLSNISSQLMIYKKSCDALKTEKRRLIEKSNELKKLEFGDSLIIKSEDVYITPEVLGYGSYSVVYAAQYCGKQCVVKRIRPSNEKSHKSLNKELKVLLTLKHPCIIQLLGVFFTSDNPQSPVLLMERMKMNLTETLNIKKSFHFKVSVLHDVACGLCYIHKKGIIHCDLTGNNILLTEKCNAKIADFGQAIIYDQEYDKGLPTAPGNKAHMPPESFKPNPVYSTNLDVFSFGCVIIHTVTQEFPIPDNKYVETSEQGKYKELSEVDRRSKQINTLKSNRDGNTILYDMVLECLQDDPHNRPAMEKVCKQLKEIEKLGKLLGHTTLEHCQYIITDIEHDIEKFADNYTVGRASLQVESTRLHIKSETLPPKLLVIEQQLQLTNELQKFKHVPPSIEEETTYIQWLNTRQQQVDITKIFVKQMTVLTNLNVIESQYGGKKYNYHFQFLFTEGESLIVSCDESHGWSVYPTGITEIFYEQLDYWKYHDNVKELLKLEKKKVFPP